VLADVVDEQRSYSSAVVGRSDGAVSLLAGGIPDLSLDGLSVDLDRSGCEFDADCRLGVEVELVAGESTQQVGFTNARVSDEDDCGVLASGASRTERQDVPLKRNYRTCCQYSAQAHMCRTRDSRHIRRSPWLR
jgi:hypothetical protein